MNRDILGFLVSRAEATVIVLVLLLVAERLGELLIARGHARRLAKSGLREVAGRQMIFFVVLHAGFFISLLAETRIYGAEWTPWGPLWLGLFLLAQGLRFWSQGSLGPFWNTRIYVHPEMELRRKGPYRLIRHPNYLAVITEMLSFPLIFTAWRTAIVLSILNGLMLRWRIRTEEAALRESATPDSWAAYEQLPRFIPRRPRWPKPASRFF